jgi:hypothetical protein
VTIAQNLAISAIQSELPRLTAEISPAQAIAAGAYDIADIPGSPAALAALRATWNIAITRTFLLALAAGCAALPFTAGMEWLNTKRVAESRRDKEESPNPVVGDEKAGS